MLRVVPLFETLDDLNHAETAMRQLFSTPWYAAHIQGKQVRGRPAAGRHACGHVVSESGRCPLSDGP